MSRNSRTTDFLKECIADALLSLLKDKSISEITIEEIVNKAEVGRTTYFRNFSSKQEVITFKLITLWKRYALENDIKETTRFSSENSLSFFEFNFGIKETLQIIYSSGLQSSLLDSFTSIMLPTDSRMSKSFYREKFYSYGLFGLLDEWILRDFKETPEEMSNILLEFLNH